MTHLHESPLNDVFLQLPCRLLTHSQQSRLNFGIIGAVGGLHLHFLSTHTLYTASIRFLKYCHVL